MQVQDLADRIAEDPALKAQLTHDPEGVLKTVAATAPLQSDVHIYRLVVVSLGLCVILSVAGAMLLHSEPLTIGGEAPVRMEVSAKEALVLYGEIVWSRPHRSSGQHLSGVRFTEWIEVAQHAIDELLRSKAIRLDTSAPPVKVD